MIVFPGDSHPPRMPMGLVLIGLPIAFLLSGNGDRPMMPDLKLRPASGVAVLPAVPRPHPAPRKDSSLRTAQRSVRASDRYDAIILKTAKANRLDPFLIKAIIYAESQFNRREVSPAGACGLMQLMPRTAKLLSVKDIFDPEENIRAGAVHLRYLLNRFSHNLALTLAAYNAGELPVLRHKGVPPYPETQQYVRKVLRAYAYYREEAAADLRARA
jgi:soluble lytic murein transglycosylase-like protein